MTNIIYFIIFIFGLNLIFDINIVDFSNINIIIKNYYLNSLESSSSE